MAEARKAQIRIKQQRAEQRLEEQRQAEIQNELIRKEMFVIKNEMKKVNAERKKRKDIYKIEKVKEELEFDDMRRVAFSTQKDEFKSIRVKNQTQAQQQREMIRVALHHMAVWNVWDMDVVKKIITEPGSTAHRTIEDMVRKRSAVAAYQKRHASMSRGIFRERRCARPV